MFCDILNEQYIVLLRGEKRHIGLPDPCRNLNFKETKHMKKFSRILSVLCILCLLLSIAVIPAAGVSANSAVNRIVHIRNMWNSNYMINDGGVGKYTPSAAGSDNVWTITFGPTSATIRSWDGTYLRAVNGGVSCEPLVANDASFLWNISSANNGRVRILSVSQTGKAINIENLTGSLQLTNYYDTWESAQWILEDTTAPEPSAETDTVIFQSADQASFLYGGCIKGPMNVMQANIIDGNYRYRVIDKGGYCYIQYAPVNGSVQYLIASSSGSGASAVCTYTLDENDPAFRWNIQENGDGTISIVSVYAAGMCVSTSSSTEMVPVSTSGTTGKWTMHQGNSLLVRFISDSTGNSRSLGSTGVGGDTDENAYFNFVSSSADTSVQWQVIYSGTDVYLKNAFNGKYLKAPSAAGDIQLKVTDYNAAEDSLYRWSTARPRYAISLSNGSAYVYVDNSSVSPSAPRARYDAFISTTFPYGSSYLQYESTGFAQ